jgi:hypothetical protein
MMNKAKVEEDEEGKMKDKSGGSQTPYQTDMLRYKPFTEEAV